MTRLDTVIKRLMAQRSCLNAAAETLGNMAGPVLELGLGNGRTYDHLRFLFPAVSYTHLTLPTICSV